MYMFLVKYSGGGIDDPFSINIFITSDQDIAEKYVKKFNDILARWKQYYKKFEQQGVIADEFVQEYGDRWWRLYDIKRCHYEIIQVR